MKTNISGTDSLVVFHNSQGLEGRGTLMHLTRSQAVFEVYNPYSIVQLSEVLTGVKILRGERTIYTGNAVVNSLVPTGLMVIVSATLLDPWSDLAGLATGEEVQEEVENFIRDWEATYALRPSYQLAVSNIRAFLGELSRWLEQVEVMAAPKPSSQDHALQHEFVEEVEESLMPKLDELFGVFEEEAAQVPREEVEAHKAFARREIHPLTLCSPFVHRTYTKPLGYAGDYEMVNMMLRDPIEGPNAYAKIINCMNLRKPAAQAHRNRIEILMERLRSECGRVAGTGGTCRVMNVGCGPAAELQRFVRQDPLADRCKIDLLDFNQQTLEYVRDRLQAAKRDSRRHTELNFIHKSIHDLLREVAKYREPAEAAYDFVYCAGLFDYFSDRICSRLIRLFLEWTLPGGLVLVTNVHPHNPSRFNMEHLLEWYLTYRNEADMLELVPDPGAATVSRDPTGVNVFLETRKVPS